MPGVLPCLLSLLLSLTPQEPASPATPTASSPTDPFAVLEQLPAQPSLERGVRVTVRDAKGDAVADARLVYVDSADPKYTATATDATKHFPGDEPGYFASRMATGTRYQLDDRGATRVPATSGRVLAWKDGLCASSVITIQDGKSVPKIDLELRAPIACTVTVLDAKGQPANGVPVTIAYTLVPRISTDTNGLATIRRLDGKPDPNRKPPTVRLLVASIEPIEAPVPENGGEVTLRLPECGSVQATFSGELLPSSSVRWSLAHGNRSAEPMQKSERSATFAFVQVGFPGEVVAIADSSTTKVAVGTITAGAVTNVAVQRATDTRRLVVRMLLPDGTPARAHYVQAQWKVDGSSSGTGSFTNEEGWFESEAPTYMREAATVRIDLRGRAWSDGTIGTLDLAIGKDDQGRIDRGEMRVAAATPTIAGTVVDKNGKPLAGVTFQVRHEGYHTFKSDAAGRFQCSLPGDKPAALTLQTQGMAWSFIDPTNQSRSIELSLNLRLVMQPAGRVRFDAAGLPEEFSDDFSARLEPASGDGDKIDVDVSFNSKELLLPPGHWNFVITEANQEVHRLDGLRVDAGVEVHDARFMAFDWKAFANLVTVRVEDKDGKPCDDCTVWHEYANYGSGRPPTNGVCRWLVRKDGGKMRVEPKDKAHATVELGVVTGEQVVRFGKGPRLEVQLDVLPTLPPHATLILRAGDSHDGVPVDATGKAVIWLAEAGECTPHFAVRLNDRVYVVSASKRSIDVPKGGITVPWPVTKEVQKEIDDALKR